MPRNEYDHRMEKLRRTAHLADHSAQSQRVRDIRPVGRLNPDGSASSVLMTSLGVDGKWYAVPTLFPRDPQTPTSDPSDWLQLEGMDAWREAQQRNELFEFATDAEAQDFAAGSWKNIGKK